MDQRDLQTARDRLLRQLRQEVQDERVLAAIARVPREQFVPLALYDRAYEDIALPIEEGQSISQPLLVALMTHALGLKGGERVLEVGTGSGYQAAVLAALGAKVVTVERHPALATEASLRLQQLGYGSVDIHIAHDGTLGWPELAPYDAILVTAAAPMAPQALLDQLVDGGLMVLPVGPRQEQELLVVTKQGEFIRRKGLGSCRFVPLIGPGAWPAAQT